MYTKTTYQNNYDIIQNIFKIQKLQVNFPQPGDLRETTFT